MAHHCCQDFSRTELLRRAAAGAARTLPEPRDPRMPEAGRQAARPAAVPAAQRGRDADRLRRIAARTWASFEEGVAQAAGRRRPGARERVPGRAASTRCRCWPRWATRSTASCARSSRCRAAARRSPRTGGCEWHPSAAPLATLHGEGKLSVMPAIGYDHPDQSHFNSRHFWEVGALDPKLATGWMGRYLDRVGTPDNPLQGLSLDGDLAPSIATARVPVAAVSGAGPVRLLGAGRLGRRRGLDARDASRRSAPATPAAATPAMRAGRRRRGPVRRRLRRAAARRSARTSSTGPVAYPRGRLGLPAER